MKRSRFSKEQILGILKEQKAEMPIAEICRHGISNATLTRATRALPAWRSRTHGV